MKLRSGFALVLMTATALSVGVAFAADQAPVVDAFKQLWANSSGAAPTIGKVDANGTSVTITDVKVTFPSGDTPNNFLAVPKTELTGVDPEKDGFIHIAKAVYENMEMQFSPKVGQPVKVSIPSAVMTDLNLPVAVATPDDKQAMRQMFVSAGSTDTGPITITAAGQQISSEGFVSSWSGDIATATGKSKYTFKDIAVPEAALAAIDQGGVAKSLGYTKLTLASDGNFDVTVNGDAFNASGTMNYIVREMGTVNVSFDVENVPAAFVVELKKARNEKREPNFTALQPQLENIVLKSAKLHFTDASITSKILPLVAARNGSTVDQVKAMAGPMVQIGLAQIQLPSLAESAAKAVTAYLNDPKSITVSLSPPSPVKVGQLKAAGSPSKVVELLGVSITSND